MHEKMFDILSYKGMQIEAMLRLCVTQVRMAIVKKANKFRRGHAVGEEPSYTVRENVN
jgi:hypothetical protein